MLMRSAASLALATGLAATPALAQDSDTTYCESAFFPTGSVEGTLSADEVSAANSGAFESIDADASGAISREEFTACTDAAFRAATGRMPSAMEGDMSGDAVADSAPGDGPDNDDTVDAGDAAGMADTGSLATGETGSDAYVASFDVIDADADGIVTVPEYVIAALAAHEAAMAGQDSQPNWAEPYGYAAGADTSGMTPDQFGSTAATAFWGRDADADQQLTRQEWIDRGDDLTPTAERVNQKFKGMDSDGSGDLSPDEYAAGTEAWIDAADTAAQASGSAVERGEIPVMYYYFYR